MNIERISMTSYYAGEIKEKGKDYPFTITCNEYDSIDFNEIDEITWVDKVPPNCSKWELEIRDEFKKCYGY